MEGVLKRIRWPQKRLVVDHSPSAPKADRKDLELQAAKEILAEIFDIRVSDVEEMFHSRFDEAAFEEHSHKEPELWPREFVLQ